MAGRWLNAFATAADGPLIGSQSEIDALYRKCYGDLLATMRSDPQTIDRASKLMWTAKSIERIGDHVTNIGEWVVFLETGQLVELNA